VYTAEGLEPLPSPWALVPGEARAALESEPIAEVGFVSVHLTWRGAQERPPWPTTEYLRMPLSRNLAAHDHS
jgi:hypothetical protein